MTERERFEKWRNDRVTGPLSPPVTWFEIWQASAREQLTRLELAEKKLAEFGQVWDGKKYVFDGRESFFREAGTKEKK